jgi:hypothetical protein
LSTMDLDFVRPASGRKAITSQPVNRKPAPVGILSVDGLDLAAGLR